MEMNPVLGTCRWRRYSVGILFLLATGLVTLCAVAARGDPPAPKEAPESEGTVEARVEEHLAGPRSGLTRLKESSARYGRNRLTKRLP